MQLTYAENNLKKCAALLGILQGLAYGLMAFLCILFYNMDLRNLTVETYWDVINANFYSLYLSTDEKKFEDQTMFPQVFTFFAWVYFLLHLGWLVASIELVRKKNIILIKYLTAWSHLTFLISLWDFITVVILGADYAKCLKGFPGYGSLGDIESEQTCATAILPVLVIAARGFVLWIINVIFAVILNKTALRLKKKALTVYQSTSAPAGFQVQLYSGTNVSPRSPQSIPSATPSLQNLNMNLFQYPVQRQESSSSQNVNRNQVQYPVQRQESGSYTPPTPLNVNRNQVPKQASSPYIPFAPQNVNRNQVQYIPPIPQNRNQNRFPVDIPDPDYYYKQQVPPGRRY